jgi:hypothetical protein
MPAKAGTPATAKTRVAAETPTAAAHWQQQGRQQQQNTQEDASLVRNSMSLFVFLGYTFGILSEVPCTSDFPKSF